jgi:hypothetical protein
MKSMITISANSRRNYFERIQQRLLSLFLKGEDLINRYIHEQKKIDQTREEYYNFLEQNSKEDVEQNSVEHIARKKRLKKRLWFTIVVEAILSLSAIKFFLAEMLNIKLLWLSAVILGVFLSSLIIEWAIGTRIDDNQEDNTLNTKNDILCTFKKLSYIIPLILIPVINFYIIITTPGNPLNILYAFFAVFSLLLNLKTVSYWQQYKLLKHSSIANSKIKNIKNNISKGDKILYDLTSKMKSLKDKITSEGMRLRSEYENYNSKVKPGFILPVKYLFVLNNLIFQNDVFHIPQLQLTSPPIGDMNDDLEVWGALIFTHPVPPKPSDKVARKLPNSQRIQNNIYDSENNGTDIEDSHPIGDDLGNEININTNPASFDNPGNTNLDPGANTGIPDNEKYV